ncbi:hypothetical protein BDV25DRAFT_136717 [Aspergillus avenaceus]|uniref:Uncharacterized protein n=1 Tax=Aspergillus avenaceus TaxID=36643 RepID=A0A5N6U4N4_ASPAV|nr:hypothetical protein BDV25DRAFT_136717 [Aspergillus avenaceus]
MDGRPLVFDLKGSTITIPDIPGRPPSTRILHIKRVWRDIFERELGLIHVLCLVENILTRERHIAKIRYELNPKHFKFDNLHAQRDLAEYRFKCEVDAARLLGDNEYGPRYMTHWKQIQSINMPFPGGLIYFLIMGTVPGDIIPENLHDKLTDAQRVDIRRQLTRMLE